MRRLAAVCALWMLALTCGAWPAAAATPLPADTSDTAPQVTITELTPRFLSDTTDDLTVSGTITNPGTEPLSDLSLALDIGVKPIVAREQLLAWDRGKSAHIGTLWQVVRETEPTLAPGQTLPFTLHAHASDLPQGTLQRFGAHAARVIARASAPDGTARLGSARTFLPVAPPASDYRPTPLLVVATATAPGAALTGLTAHTGAARGILEGDFMPDNPERAPVAGLTETFEALAKGRPGVAFLVDPSLLSATSPLITGEMAVRRHVGVSIDEDARAAVATAIARGASVSLDLWGAPDRALAQAAKAASALEAAHMLGDSVATALPDVAWGPAFAPTRSAVPNDLPAGRDVIPVVPSGAVRYTEQRFHPDARARVGERDVLVADADLSSLFEGPAGDAAQTLKREQLASALLAHHTAERPTQPRMVVVTAVANPVLARRVGALEALPWVRLAHTDEAALGGGERPTVQPTPAALEVNPQVRGALERTAEALTHVEALAEHADLTVRPLLFQRAFALSRVLTPADRDVLAKRLRAEAEDILGGVSSKTAPSINIISRTADIPVQVTNNLPYPVQVIVDVQVSSPILSTTAAKARVAGRSSTTVQVPVEVRSNGDARALVAVRPVTGAPATPPERVWLHTRMGLEDRFLLVAAGLGAALFVAGVIRSVMKGRRMGPPAPSSRSRGA